MHIPDGYLSPETCAVGAAVMVPSWSAAGRRVRKTVKSRYVPLLAIGAAYAFLVDPQHRQVGPLQGPTRRRGRP